ncbi:DUF721 domain-containing protein [bacterium]|jgi:hypothetical protein|nr:DUF721 domain-containing protein [bacterium]
MKGKVWPEFLRREWYARKKISKKKGTHSAGEFCEDQLKEYEDKRVFSNNQKLELRNYLKICREWGHICGDLLKDHLRPHSLWRGTLKLEASNGAFIEQARFIQKDLHQRLERILPEIQIKEIRFMVGDLSRQPYTQDSNPEETSELSLKERLEQILNERSR